MTNAGNHLKDLRLQLAEMLLAQGTAFCTMQLQCCTPSTEATPLQPVSDYELEAS
jgi:hypothetical protein